jgi:hypothetical protein
MQLGALGFYTLEMIIKLLALGAVSQPAAGYVAAAALPCGMRHIRGAVPARLIGQPQASG